MADVQLDDFDDDVDPDELPSNDTLGESAPGSQGPQSFAQAAAAVAAETASQQGAPPAAAPAQKQAAAPAAQPVQAAAATQQDEPTLRDWLREQGYAQAAQAADDAAALEAIIENQRLLEHQRQSYAYALSQMQAQYQQLAAQQQQAQQGAAQQTPAAIAPKDWNPPEWDPRYLSMIDFDANGQPVPKVGADPTLPQKYLAWRDHYQNVAHQLASRPAEFLGQFGFVTQQQAEERARHIYREEMQRFQAEAQLQSIRQQHGQWLYQHDARGAQVIDPISGQPMLTNEGRMVDATFTQLVQAGIPHLHAFQLAVAPLQAALQQQLLAGQQTQQAASAAPAGQQTQQQANRNFLRGAALAARGAGSGTTAARRTASPPPGADFMDLAREDAQALGIPLN